MLVQCQVSNMQTWSPVVPRSDTMVFKVIQTSSDVSFELHLIVSIKLPVVKQDFVVLITRGITFRELGVWI